MQRVGSVLGVIVVMLAVLPPAWGQKATEQFIPLGQSPGLSLRSTYVGAVTAIDTRTKTITLAAPAGGQTATINERTSIWLDRSRLKQANVVGSFADLRIGQKMEVKFAEPAGQKFAEWIKVEIAEAKQ